MEKKRRKLIVLALLIITFFFIHFVSAEITSPTYSVDSYHLGLSGGNISNAVYDSRFTSTAQQGSRDAESSNFILGLDWFFYPSFCNDGVCDSDETCTTCPNDCGACPPVETPTTPSTGSPSGGGGAGETCSKDWVCSEWYPDPCPTEGIQKRVCVNRGSCATEGMPELSRECVPGYVPPAEPLFDLFAKIPLSYKYILQGDPVEIQVELINMGNRTKLDVFFKYWIVDENNHLIAEVTETKAIAEGDKFLVRFPTSAKITAGVYKFYVQIDYDERVAIAEDSFEIVQSRFLVFLRIFLKIILIPLIILIILIVLIIIILRRRRYKGVVITRKREKSKRKIIEAQRGNTLLEFFRELRKERRQRAIERYELRQRETRLRHNREMRIMLMKEKEKRLQKSRESRRRTLEEKKRLSEKRQRRLAEERTETRRIEERHKIEEMRRRKKKKLFQWKKREAKKPEKKKRRKFINLILTRGGHEEKVQIEK